MGGRKQDNFIVVNIDNDKSVSFELIALNGDNISALGKLEDYVLNGDANLGPGETFNEET